MSTITKPKAGTYPAYFETYIKLVKGENIFDELFQSYMDTMDLVTSLDPETLLYRYAEGKWNILEIMQHILDTERIFNYRALCFSRQDKTNLPGFEQDDYVVNANVFKRDINDMVRELSLVRASTIELFKSFTPEMLEYSGTANGNIISVKALLFATLGHEIHHRKVIEEKYVG
jgi:uncharacterized damage-inducible protein DinB